MLDTARGQPILNVQVASISHPLAARALEAQAAAHAILRARTNPRFNCHGLTFAARRTAIHEDSEVLKILRSDGYVRVPLAEVLPGDVAVYYTSESTIDHSAVVVTSPAPPTNVPLVCSKWGVIGPEVIHSATECLEYAVADIRYYRVTP